MEKSDGQNNGLVLSFTGEENMAFDINNRRYTGCKNKLLDWIFELVREECRDASSFFDIFAGTGVVTAAALPLYKKFIINDFLYSNEIIFKAFFSKEDYSEEKIYKYYSKYLSLDEKDIKPNFASINYGGKFFSLRDALIIGEIRNDIEENRAQLNEKEYAVLLSSLLFSADRAANTCGHYDAYIKKDNLHSSFKFELVNPIIKIKDDGRDITIYREDANLLAKSGIKSDIVYIDPPYSSRQYSRFYHVLETLTKWDNPPLFGTALKPKEENMSEYCKTKALDTFKDLIYSLDAKYLVVSYNNTYNSRSSSSRNKMTLEDIKELLMKKGRTTIHHKEHKAFNAGKTNLEDHEEYLFITKVGEKND